MKEKVPNKLTPTHPDKWASFSKHGGLKIDDNGRYLISVGPKILNPNYSDNGLVSYEDFGDKQVDFYRIDIELKHVETGATKVIECVVRDLKAHTYNHHLSTDNGGLHRTFDFNRNLVAKFKIESGLVQTGVGYPYCWNVTRSDHTTNTIINDGPFAVEHIDSSVIEFYGNYTDFGTENYRLVKVTVVDERILERFYN